MDGRSSSAGHSAAAVQRGYSMHNMGLCSTVAGPGSRLVSIAESQPPLKVSFNRPRPRSHPARPSGRVCVSLFYVIDTGSISPRVRIPGEPSLGFRCVLVVYFFSRQLGKCFFQRLTHRLGRCGAALVHRVCQPKRRPGDCPG